MYSFFFIANYMSAIYLRKIYYHGGYSSEMGQSFTPRSPINSTSGLKINPPKESVLKKSRSPAL